LTRLLKEESGYSLVEVMVAMMILAIAIIPMVGMFDTGLRSITTSSKYDQARALANQNLERVKALDYATAVSQYPPSSRSCPTGAGGLDSCTVTTTYVNSNLTPDPTYKDAMRIDVSVQWGGSSYTTTGLKTKGST
jgi:prepilin-type N-terminal cleavage/methylation domain-containing protein